MPSAPDRAGQKTAATGGQQSRTMSLVEATTNVVVGYLLALATQFAVFPWLGLTVSMTDNLLISGVFTGVSIVRSYILRRLFEVIALVRTPTT